MEECAQQTLDKVAAEVIEMLRTSSPVSASLLLSVEHEQARFAPRAGIREKSGHHFSAILVDGDFGICGIVDAGLLVIRVFFEYFQVFISIS